MTDTSPRHVVTVTRKLTCWLARCDTCEQSLPGTQAEAEDWKDQHEADTLVPQAFAGYDLTDVKQGTGFFVPKDEGRPSGSERLAPRSDDDLVAHLRNLVTRLKDNVRTGEEKGVPNEIAFDDGWCGAMVHAGHELETLLDQYGPNGWDVAAQAALSEATPKWVCTGESHDADLPEPCAHCVPSPSLRKEGEDTTASVSSHEETKEGETDERLA